MLEIISLAALATAERRLMVGKCNEKKFLWKFIIISKTSRQARNGRPNTFLSIWITLLCVIMITTRPRWMLISLKAQNVRDEPICLMATQRPIIWPPRIHVNYHFVHPDIVNTSPRKDSASPRTSPLWGDVNDLRSIFSSIEPCGSWPRLYTSVEA